MKKMLSITPEHPVKDKKNLRFGIEGRRFRRIFTTSKAVLRHIHQGKSEAE